MKQHSARIARYILPVKTLGVMAFLLFAIFSISSAFNQKNRWTGNTPGDAEKDSVASVQAFMQVYRVLMSPRCMNCHPAGDRPLQGDDSHLHTMNVKRGKDGKGMYALKCANCHQSENTPGLHTPPGNPEWHLPPANMKMVFEGKTPRELALQLLDYERNGHKTKEQLLEHAHDGLVIAGWNMGEGRTPPPLSYDEFVAAWNTWLTRGAYAPR